VRARVGRRSSVASRAATSGPVAKRIAPWRPAISATTDFVGTDGPGGGRFPTIDSLVTAIADCWFAATRCTDPSGAVPYVVFTGGEPLLQLDAALLAACRALGFETAVETNGTIPVPEGIDWLTVSPKPNSELVVRRGNELKLVYPQAVTPESVAHLDFETFYLQPMDGPDLIANLGRTVEYCRRHPRWRLSLQIHKLAGIP
jgi:7-carboxy-7-deazaguanine synthase (Cx14CxxC type)